MRPHLIATLRAAQRLDETGTGEVAAGTLGGTFNYMSGIRRQPNASGEAAVGERIEEVPVDEIRFSQPTCRSQFSDGRFVHDTIRDLDRGLIDPLNPPFELIAVVYARRQKRY